MNKLQAGMQAGVLYSNIYVHALAMEIIQIKLNL